MTPPSKLGMSTGGVLREDKPLSDDSFLTELIDKRKLSKFVLLPGMPFRLSWDIIIAVLVFYTAAFLPIVLAFPNAASSFSDLTDFELALDFFFLFDMAVNFRTAYYDKIQARPPLPTQGKHAGLGRSHTTLLTWT